MPQAIPLAMAATRVAGPALIRGAAASRGGAAAVGGSSGGGGLSTLSKLATGANIGSALSHHGGGGEAPAPPPMTAQDRVNQMHQALNPSQFG